nr:hypothetical protein [Tanacetum cinerariifolium]
NNNKDDLVDGKEHDDDIQKSVSPNIHSSSNEFEEYNNNSSNGVNAASSLVSTAGQNFINNIIDFSAAGPSNAAMPNLEDLSYDADDVGAEADINNLESIISVRPIPTTRIHKDHPTSQIIGDLSSTTQTRSMARAVRDQEEPKRVYQALKDLSWIEAMQEELLQFKMQKVWILIDLPYRKRAIVARIEAIRLFLAYASFMGFLVYQMDVKSAFLYGTIEEEVYVCPPPGFEDPENPNKVYKVVKALYGLHQAPRAWYETLATYLLENGFQRGTIDQTFFIKKQQKDILLVQIYIDDIIFGLQVKQKKDGIFISQDKYVAKILKKFRLSEGKSASTPIDAKKPLLKDSDVKRIFRYLKGNPYLGLWYPKDSPFDLVAYSDSDYVEAEYVAAASGCAQVLWIQNQLLDYGVFNLPMLHVLRVEMVINSLWTLPKNWLVQKQTNFGKDISNPFMDENLPKNVWFLNSPCFFNEELASPKANGSCDSPFLGVNTPRCDEDRLKLMELMVFLLQKDVCVEIRITAACLSSYYCQKSDAAQGFEQIIDFISGSYIHYALTVSPYIYISCIKQFWNSVSVKGSGDVTRRGMLANEEIFAGLAQIGYEKPSTKLTFYKAFFSSHWKFLIHTILQSLSAKRTSWNEFSIAMASAVICLSKGQKFNFSKYNFDSLGMIADRQPAEEELRAEQVQVDVAVAVVEDVVDDVAEDVAHVATPSPPLHGISSPPQEPSSPPQQPHITPPAPTQSDAFPATFQQRLEIVKLKARVKKLEKTDKLKSLKFRCLRKVGASRQVESSDDMEDVFNQGRMMNEDEGIKLVKDDEIAESEGRQADKQAEIYNIDLDHSSKVLSMQEDDSKVQEVVEVVTTAKLITKVVTAAASQVSVVSTTIPAASETIPAAKPSIPAAASTVVAAYTRRRKGVIIRDPEEELPLKTPVDTPKVKDKGKGILVEALKPMKKKDQIEMDEEYARKLQEEIDRDHYRFNKDVDWDAAMDHEALKVVEDEDDDVFVKATPLASKVPVVDYQIVLIDNKPRYKIIRADDTHQLYINFTTLLKNFDREDLETL